MPNNNSLLEVLQLYRLNGNKIASFYKQSEVKTKFYYPFKRYNCKYDRLCHKVGRRRQRHLVQDGGGRSL